MKKKQQREDGKITAKSLAHFSRANSNLWCSQHKQFVIVVHCCVENGVHGETEESGLGDEKQQRRVRTKCETNFRRLNIELGILGMCFFFFFHPQSL